MVIKDKELLWREKYHHLQRLVLNLYYAENMGEGARIREAKKILYEHVGQVYN